MSVSSSIDSFTVIETEYALQVRADSAYEKFRKVKATGDPVAIESALDEWNEADNTRLKYSRAVSSVKDLLDSEK